MYIKKSIKLAFYSYYKLECCCFFFFFDKNFEPVKYFEFNTNGFMYIIYTINFYKIIQLNLPTD